IDGQVKIRGYRVELEEIVAALKRDDSVRSCAVVLRENEAGPARLTAYVVPTAVAHEADLNEAQDVYGSAEYSNPPQFRSDSATESEPNWHGLGPRFRSFLRESLPEHMVPSTFVLVKELPLTFSGKIDLAALPPATPDGDEAENVSGIPRNDVEALLVRV